MLVSLLPQSYFTLKGRRPISTKKSCTAKTEGKGVQGEPWEKIEEVLSTL